VRFLPRPLILTVFFGVVSVVISIDAHVGAAWLISGAVAGLLAGVAWWIWVRRHGLRMIDPKHGSLWIAFGLFGALLIAILSPPTKVALFGFGATLTFVTAFPPKESQA
jgi:hypothetical protein